MLKKPDYFFLAAALLDFFLANFLLLSGLRDEAIFVSIWVPANIILGIYFRNVSSITPHQN
ncbi:hypothetical protein Ctha_2327 [Chloroherpeton thalassium ATCC 35110]|uniref:Uncharacterized protein n=1 Tax=Chloroherpeton thalassium (strain ATCC 35110 / GB-78) TaxID=517418 RepID=B3QWL7_CHLT3|nr:hypothetical protein Ctha_2327 [Chloroherpeton thalassium ATCC 35110]